jgi:hypothetical protein
MSITVAGANPLPWWKEPSKDQWLAWIAAWLGWTLDGEHGCALYSARQFRGVDERGRQHALLRADRRGDADNTERLATAFDSLYASLTDTVALSG